MYDWGWPKNGLFWTKNGQTWQACQRSKWVQKSPKATKMVSLSLFDHLGPFWAHLDPFWPFQTRIDILLRSTSAKPYFVHVGQKIVMRAPSHQLPPAEFPGRILSLLPAFRRSIRADKEKWKRLDIWSSRCDDIIMIEESSEQDKTQSLPQFTIHIISPQILVTSKQGGIKCANRRTGFIDSEGSHR